MVVSCHCLISDICQKRSLFPLLKASSDGALTLMEELVSYINNKAIEGKYLRVSTPSWGLQSLRSGHACLNCTGNAQASRYCQPPEQLEYFLSR